MYARTGAGPPVSVMSGAGEAAEANGGVLVLRHADAGDDTAAADDSDRLLVGRYVTDRLEDDLAASVGEVPDLGDAVLAALGDDIGGAELPAEIGPCSVPAHEHDSLGAELPGRQDGQEADRDVADDGCRSLPQTQARTTRTSASVGCSMVGRRCRSRGRRPRRACRWLACRPVNLARARRGRACRHRYCQCLPPPVIDPDSRGMATTDLRIEIRDEPPAF
jgi:hypothetical protein